MLGTCNQALASRDLVEIFNDCNKTFAKRRKSSTAIIELPIRSFDLVPFASSLFSLLFHSFSHRFSSSVTQPPVLGKGECPVAHTHTDDTFLAPTTLTRPPLGLLKHLSRMQSVTLDSDLVCQMSFDDSPPCLVRPPDQKKTLHNKVSCQPTLKCYHLRKWTDPFHQLSVEIREG